MRIVTLRILVPAEEGVKVETVQAALQASLRRRGTIKMDTSGEEAEASAEDSLLCDRLVFWGAVDVRRGAETRAAKSKKTAGATSDG